MDDFCRPTTCKYCGQHVYFIRHNGGAFWAEPPLGWPWMKHPCYDPSENESAALRWYEKAASSLVNPTSALVLRCGYRHYWSNTPDSLYLKLQDGCYLRLRIAPQPRDTRGNYVFYMGSEDEIIRRLIGSVVLYSASQSVISSPLLKYTLSVCLIHELSEKQVRLCKMGNVYREWLRIPPEQLKLLKQCLRLDCEKSLYIERKQLLEYEGDDESLLLQKAHWLKVLKFSPAEADEKIMQIECGTKF